MVATATARSNMSRNGIVRHVYYDILTGRKRNDAYNTSQRVSSRCAGYVLNDKDDGRPIDVLNRTATA